MRILERHHSHNLSSREGERDDIQQELGMSSRFSGCSCHAKHITVFREVGQHREIERERCPVPVSSPVSLSALPSCLFLFCPCLSHTITMPIVQIDRERERDTTCPCKMSVFSSSQLPLFMLSLPAQSACVCSKAAAAKKERKCPVHGACSACRQKC